MNNNILNPEDITLFHSSMELADTNPSINVTKEMICKALNQGWGIEYVNYALKRIGFLSIKLKEEVSNEHI